MKTLLKITTILLVTFIFFSFQSIEKIETSESIPIRGWVKLGKRIVSKGADHDVLIVTQSKGKFRKLQFKITRSPVHINSIIVVFADGSRQNIAIKKNFKRGTSTRVIDLKGKRRIINKIIFNYHTKFLARGKARIHVFGRR